MSRWFPESTGARCGQTLAACVVSTENPSNKNSRTLFIEWSLMKLLRIGVGDKKNAWFTKDGVWDRRWQNVSVEWSPLPPAVSVMHFARVAWHRWDANHFSKLTIYNAQCSRRKSMWTTTANADFSPCFLDPERHFGWIMTVVTWVQSVGV